MAFRKPNLERKYPIIFKIGEITEEIFFRSAKRIFPKIRRATEREDLFERIDFFIERENQLWGVDVKGRRKRKRCGKDYAVVIEIVNKGGKYIFSKGFTHYAIENPFEKTFWIVPKLNILQFLKTELNLRNIHTEAVPKFFSLYKRGKSISYIVPEEYFFNRITPLERVPINWREDMEIVELLLEREKLRWEISEKCLQLSRYG